MKTAYERWLIRNANTFPYPKHRLAYILEGECLNRNDMAFDIVARIQPDNWTNETFEKAAELLLNIYNNKALI